MWTSSVCLCQKHKPQHLHHMKVSPPGQREREKERERISKCSMFFIILLSINICHSSPFPFPSLLLRPDLTRFQYSPQFSAAMPRSYLHRVHKISPRFSKLEYISEFAFFILCLKMDGISFELIDPKKKLVSGRGQKQGMKTRPSFP